MRNMTKIFVLALGFILLASVSFGQVFDPSNLAQIDTEIEQVWTVVVQQLEDELIASERGKYAQLTRGYSVGAVFTLPTCDSLKQPIFEVPLGATYTLRDLQLHNVGPFRCSFSIDERVTSGRNGPVKIDYMLRCACSYQGRGWMKTKYSNPTAQGSRDWFVFYDLP